jgi:L-cysteine S-thiosulfotransferase
MELKWSWRNASMPLRLRIWTLATLLAAATACGSGRHSSAGFRLPPDGNPDRGKIEFVALGCNSCHRVAGVDLPAPTVQPAVPVVLGGEVNVDPADGYLAASIVYPSYRLAAYPRQQIATDGQSRMPSYADRISVRQLTDVVAFLQAQYNVVPPAPAYLYH